ncbi:hypothetical protein LTR95_012439 [Oleoguttula sp. CCFEE 5521]
MAPKRSRSPDSYKVSASPKPQRRRANKPRPSAEWVEISAEEVERAKAPRLRGALRGLNPNVVLMPRATQGPTTASADVDDETTNLRSSFRGGRNTAAIYSAKYHPMDDITRPKRAEKITGRRARMDLTDDESNESEPELGNDDDSHITIDDDDRGMRIGATQHTPDPAATRHSKRSEARKAVIYNAKCHPQDYALPGFRTRHLARQGATRPKSSKESASENEVNEVSDRNAAEPVEIFSGVEDSESEAEDDEVTRPEIANSDATPTPEASPGRSPAVPRRSYRNDMPGEPRRPHLQDATSDVDAIHTGHHLTGHGYNGEHDDPLQLFQDDGPHHSSGFISDAIRVAADFLGQTNARNDPDEPVQPSQPAALAIVRPYSTQRPATQLPADPPIRDPSPENAHPPVNSPATQRSTFHAINALAAKTLSPVRPSSRIGHIETIAAAVTSVADTDTASYSLLHAAAAAGNSSIVPQTTASKANRAASAATRTSSMVYGSVPSRVASSTTRRRSTDGSTGSREEPPLSSHFEDAFVLQMVPEALNGYTLSQLEKSDTTTDDSLDDLNGRCHEAGTSTSAQAPAQDQEPAASNQRPVLQPIDGSIPRPRSIFGLFNNETMAQPAVLKQSQIDSLAVKRSIMEGRSMERSSSFSGVQSGCEESDHEEM